MKSKIAGRVQRKSVWIGTKITFWGIFILSIVSCTGGDFLSGQFELMSVLAQGSQARDLEGMHIRAESGATIEFKTGNGESSVLAQSTTWQIPFLVLYRNGVLTEPAERTLVVSINDLVVPPDGLNVTLKLETQHGDPDGARNPNNRFQVLHETHVIRNPSGVTQTGMTEEFEIEFGDVIQSSDAMIRTPTDYYRLEITLSEGTQQDGRVIQTIHYDYAFLLEHQVVLPLDEPGGLVSEVGPEEIVVHFADMFPFQRDIHDNSTRMNREYVLDFVQNQLAPSLVAAVHMQTENWGFSWSEAWMAFRGEGEASSMQVALTDGETWFHGRAPERGHSGIAINVNGGNNSEYETLLDGLMSTFHHELFHNLQRSLALEVGGSANLDGIDDAWQFFSEGTASFVPTVAQPEVQYAQSGEARAYFAKAIEYIGGKGFPGELNQSYSEMNPYNAALYWRTLFEKCGGMADNPQAIKQAMGVIRKALAVLYSKEVVDINQSGDLVGNLPAVMDRALSSPEASYCPFRTFNDSLVHFSRAIYALGLDRAGCSELANSSDCGLYDPQGLYSSPIADQLLFSGEEMVYSSNDQAYPAGIRNSFGIDYIEIPLTSKLDGNTLEIEFQGDPQGQAVFSVQVWKLRETNGGALQRVAPRAVSEPENFTMNADGKSHVYTIPALDREAYNCLTLIILRLDADESNDSQGAYTIGLK